jgi:putative oxidoreductase
MTPTTSNDDTLALIGRLLMAYLFVPAGWAKIADFAGTVSYISAQNVPLPEVAAALSLAIELGLGLLLLVGWQTRWAALGLAIYVLVLTPIFHHYWNLPQAQQMVQKINFDKNAAIIGGLLFLVALGAGRWSLDARGGEVGERRFERGSA